MAHAAWSTIPERGRWVPLRLLVAVIRWIGYPAAIAAVWAGALYYALTHSVARTSSREYLRHLSRTARSKGVAVPDPVFSSVVRHFAEFGHAIVDKMYAWSGMLSVDDFEFVGREAFRQMYATGQGAVVFSAHFGNVEVARALLESLADVKINVLMFTKNSQVFNRFLRDLNPSSTLRIVPLERLGVDTVLDLQERVARGECIALMADRISAGAEERRVNSSFLGEAAGFPEGPFILASLLECPVYTIWCTRQAPQRYLVRIRPFADRIVLARKNRQRDLQIWIEKYVHELENECLRAPLQWFNFFPYWKNYGEQGPDRRTEKSEPSTVESD